MMRTVRLQVKKSPSISSGAIILDLPLDLVLLLSLALPTKKASRRGLRPQTLGWEQALFLTQWESTQSSKMMVHHEHPNNPTEPSMSMVNIAPQFFF